MTLTLRTNGTDMTPEQKIERLTTWLNTYPPLPGNVSGDPELMVVQTVRRLLDTDDPIVVVRTPSTAQPEVEITDRLIVLFEDAYDLPGITGGNTRAGLRAAFEAAGIRVKETGE